MGVLGVSPTAPEVSVTFLGTAKLRVLASGLPCIVVLSFFARGRNDPYSRGFETVRRFFHVCLDFVGPEATTTRCDADSTYVLLFYLFVLLFYLLFR